LMNCASGALMTNRDALRARLDQIFRGVFRGSRHEGTLRHLRFLGPDAAAVDEDIEITRFASLPAGIRPTAPGVLRTRMRHVFQRTGGRWVIVSSQNTAVAPAQPPTPGPAPACGVRGSQQWLSTRPSPLDSATLTLGARVARICYSRPHARGRPVDSLVPPRRAWRTGANEPTTLMLTDSAEVGGAPLGAGRYVLLTVPEAEEWTVVFHTTPETEPAKMFSTLRQVAVGTGRVERLAEPVEQFTIRAAAGDSTEGAFLLEWGERRVRVPVRARHGR
jgi:hypothetical protein